MRKEDGSGLIHTFQHMNDRATPLDLPVLCHSLLALRVSPMVFPLNRYRKKVKEILG